MRNYNRTVDPDPHLVYAERQIMQAYGHKVSSERKNKALLKFGTNPSVASAAFETVNVFQGAEINETFVTTNAIDAIVSSSASDTLGVTIEGHTIDTEGNLTFVIQTATMNGQTPVALTTPLARVNRVLVSATGTFGTNPDAVVGTISIYDDTDGATAGVPDTDAAVKLILEAGNTQGRKAQTSTSSTDYLIVTRLGVGSVQTGASTDYIIFKMEIRDIKNGGAWLPFGGEVVTFDGRFNAPDIHFTPYLICPPNHDIRVSAQADGGTIEAQAEFQAYLAKVI